MKRLDLLLIDDDIETAHMTAELLQLFHDVRVATNIHLAIDELAKRPPDVLVCDLELPPFRGDVILEMVRREYPHVRRVLYSGSGRERLIPIVETGLAHAALSKPGELRELLEAIEG
jgi:DNA-binding NtrC family response regulator